MQEVFEKIIEKLEELKKAEIERDDLCDEEGCGDGEEIYEDGKSQGRFEQVVRIIEIVKQEAEQCNNGWIPCSERLPEVESDVLVSLRSLDIYTGFMANTEGCFYVVGEGYVKYENVLAWQPLPEPYQSDGE